ncbi:Metalloenzyme, LuxS/M16 peptidase-like protein [Xylaria bambusicola]|uniref:Metalloenzyme, LuxS/M16 peptidase-like protein n=1 Tax=Xylaria bambusicola TaxID=326684 RepID=UPI002008154D|nr:Metalloenzyme, LuxS/M16 peptidase-like protein [Xylaria bambusicola]KAI0526167.1 Metalloenzyme, LuxS/M16 peptidase-like protein [Xylaria bambusicola]
MSSVQDHAIMGPPLVKRVTDELKTSSIDDRQYRIIRLLNYLEVLLVHNPKMDKASVALDVNVGNFSDNKDMPSIAHAIEHRLNQLEKSQLNPKHPYCYFPTGNFKVLKTIPESKGLDLCVLGRERLNELQSLVVDLFSNVPNKDLLRNRWEDQVLFTEDQFAVQCFAKLVAGLRQLQLSFPFLDEEWLFKTWPSRYIIHLIGHKGPGSIIAYIKSKGWASLLVASVDQVCPGTSASYFTSMICSVMQKPLPRQWLLCGESLLRQFDPVAISKGVEFPGKCLPGEWNERENWYGTEYILEKIPEGLLAELLKVVNIPVGGQIPSLHLPTKNRFLPSNPEVTRKEFGRPVLAPRLIRNNQVGRTWWKKDDTFWVPKATTIISIRNPLMFASAGNYIKSTLCTDLVYHAFEESLYDARLVGMWYRVRLDSRGWKVEVSGWNNQLAILLEQVLTEMCNLDITDTMFEMVQERTIRIYKGRGLISDYIYVKEQFITELPIITVEDTRYFYKQVISQLHFEAFIYGDVLPEEEWSVPRSFKLPTGLNYLYRKSLKDPINVNHCIGYYLYVVFDQLRTKENLGYVVFGDLQSESNPMYLSSRIDLFLQEQGQALQDIPAAIFETYKESETAKHWAQIINKSYNFEAVTKADIIKFYSIFIDPKSTSRAKLMVHLIASNASTKPTECKD